MDWFRYDRDLCHESQMLTPKVTSYFVLQSHAEAKSYLIFSEILVLPQKNWKMLNVVNAWRL